MRRNEQPKHGLKPRSCAFPSGVCGSDGQTCLHFRKVAEHRVNGLGMRIYKCIHSGEVGLELLLLVRQRLEYPMYTRLKP